MEAGRRESKVPADDQQVAEVAPARLVGESSLELLRQFGCYGRS